MRETRIIDGEVVPGTAIPYASGEPFQLYPSKRPESITLDVTKDGVITIAEDATVPELVAALTVTARAFDMLRARLATAEAALADRDRHFMWDDRLRMERQIGDLATRLATAEAERAYLADRVDALNGQQDGLMQDRRTAEAERDRLLRQIARVRACPCIAGASCDELDTLYDIAAGRAPSTGTTP